MLSLLKKKTDASAALLLPAWHPNFRNYERLPDTKAVRTSFFINGGAITVALVMLVYFAAQELNLYSINSQAAEWEAQIQRDRAASDRAKTQFAQFKAEEAKLVEVAAFLAQRPVVSDLILTIAQTLPTNIALDGFDLKDTTLILRATVRGAPDLASGYASTYVDQLRADQDLAPKIEDVALTNLNRVPTTGRLAIEIVVKLKAVKAAGKK
jgi:hypothetical protein